MNLPHWCICSLILLSLSIQAQATRFAVLGDTQGAKSTAVSEEALARVVQDVLAADPPVQFVVIVGDLVSGIEYDGAMRRQFQTWRQITDPWYQSNFYGLKVYPAPGNHDQANRVTFLDLWQEAFPELPDNGPFYDKKMTYSFDVGPCHLVLVNTSAPNVLHAHSMDLDWLRNDLANSDRPVKLVFGHEPAYKVKIDRVASLDCQAPIRDQFWQTLSDNGVQAYFCGHDHGYDHWVKDNVHQIITAGGGGHGFFHYTIVDADENDVTVSVYREPENQLFESHKLSDVQNVPSEDRTVNDNPYWPYTMPACNWTSMYLVVLIVLAGLLLRND